MNKQIARAELAKLEESAAKLRKILDEPEGVWRPDYEAEYYTVSQIGEIALWRNYNQPLTDKSIVIGNCFPTKEAAELHVKKLKVIQKLRELAGGWKPDWSNRTSKYFLWYDHDQKKWGADYQLSMNYICPVYFPTMEAAQAAITTLGDELNVLLE